MLPFFTRRRRKGTPEADHFKDVTTNWPLVLEAHPDGGKSDELAAAREARLELLAIYETAVRSYIAAALRHDPDAVEQVFGDFYFRLFRGDFGGADPTKGKFRQYLKAALFRMVTDYFRGQARRPLPIGLDDRGRRSSRGSTPSGPRPSSTRNTAGS